MFFCGSLHSLQSFHRQRLVRECVPLPGLKNRRNERVLICVWSWALCVTSGLTGGCEGLWSAVNDSSSQHDRSAHTSAHSPALGRWRATAPPGLQLTTPTPSDSRRGGSRRHREQGLCALETAFAQHSRLCTLECVFLKFRVMLPTKVLGHFRFGFSYKCVT